MAMIIRFPAEAAVWRSQNRQLESGRRGEIIMFTGVRYERGEKNERRDDKPGKRKRRAKV
jgi:hypothetical protein